jgi:hypothetical protein
MKKQGFTALLVLLLLAALPHAFGQTAAVPQQAVPAPAAEEKPKAASVADAQNIDELKRTAPRVFIDGERLDMNFIKEEIQFVNYVRDRTEADVHVLITQQGTGSGGNEYTLKFIGQGLFEDLQNELKFYSNKIETRDESRRGLVQMLKLGLTPYAARTPICVILQLNLDRKVKTTAVEDRWNFWVFSVSANARLNGEMSRTSNSLFGNVSLNRTTPQAKFRLGVSTNIEETRYDYEDYKGVSTSTSRGLDGLYVFSLGEHWSVGAYLSLNYSTYSNISFGLSVRPAIEYNVFPYAQSTRRQLRILYRVGYNLDKYLEETIYDRMQDSTLSQALTATLEFTQPWGNVEVSLEGSNFLHDFSYNRFRISGNMSVRLIKGLSLTVDGRYSAIHDQLALRKGTAELEEVLLRRTELASSYSYQVRLGLNFSFGSVYSNVVNPRFGSGYGGSGGGWY